MILFMLLFAVSSLVLSRELQEEKKCLVSQIAFVQTGGVVTVPDASTVEASSPSEVFPAERIALKNKCECPNRNSFGCAQMQSGATFSLSPVPALNTIGGMVQFTGKDDPLNKNLFGIVVEQYNFNPFVSMVPKVEVFSRSLVNGTWTFGLCNELDDNSARVYRLCYVIPMRDRMGLWGTRVLLLDSAIDITSDVVFFALSRDTFSKPIDNYGRFDIALIRGDDRKPFEQKSYGVLIPPTLSDGVLRIGYQGTAGPSVLFDSFFGALLDDTTGRFDFERAKSLTPYLCLYKYGTQCDRSTAPPTPSGSEPATSATNAPAPTVTPATVDPITTAITSTSQTTLSDVSESSAAPIDSAQTTTVDRRLTGSSNALTTLVAAPLDMGGDAASPSDVDWLAVGLFIGAGVLLVIGGVMVTIVLNRRQ